MVRAGFNCWLSQLTAALLVYHRDATGEGRTECTMRCTATIACPLHVAFFSLVDAQKRNFQFLFVPGKTIFIQPTGSTVNVLNYSLRKYHIQVAKAFFKVKTKFQLSILLFFFVKNGYDNRKWNDKFHRTDNIFQLNISEKQFVGYCERGLY